MITYLALGDSYTIGEQVLPTENFPNQLVGKLRAAGWQIADPEIIAKTGWTTNELQDGMAKVGLNPPYQLVTLLIGVNNQYRGWPMDQYQREYSALLEQAIELSGQDMTKVAAVSIPDWGVTPYAAGRDRQKIAREIDAYNEMAAEICRKHGIPFIWITEGSRNASFDRELLTTDELHPSRKEYRRWAEALAQHFLSIKF
jgi:lysophospholipase L1-like esterase